MKNLIEAAAVTLFAISTAHAQNAVQWKVENGGNGHWYEYVPTRLRWPDAKQAAESRNGYLACLASAAESSFVRNLGVEIAHLGGFQAPGVCEPNCGWQWLSGEPWSYTRWAATQPDNGSGVEHVLEIDLSGTWNDYDATAERNSFIIEWDADCNNDGIVDYGQIVSAQLADANSDGIPDICQQPTCRDADLFRNGVINGADLGILLSQWGPAPSGTVSDVNRDGQVNGADLGFVLNAWGPCSN